MKKLSFLSFILFIAFSICLSVGGSFLSAQKYSYALLPAVAVAEDEQTTPNAEEEPEEPVTPLVFPSTLLNFVSISQEGYEFNRSDFVQRNLQNHETFALYTNKTVSIVMDYEIPMIENEEGALVPQYQKIDFTITVNSNPLDAESPNAREIDGKTYYFFNIDDVVSDTLARIVLRLQLDDQEPQELEFYLIQTKLRFNNGQISWNHETGTHEQIPAPKENGKYPPISVNVPDGSKLNPVFIKFNYCGEIFTIYNIGDGHLYNASTLTDLSNLGADEPLDFSTMVFDLSGTYTVEIYDNTINSHFADNNHQVFNFVINNETNGGLSKFYFSAYLEDNGTIIMDQQYVNQNTIVEFMNIADIRERVIDITVTRDFRESLGEQSKQVFHYTAQDILNNDGKILFDEHGTWSIDVRISDGNRVVTKNFEFVLINDIRIQFPFNGQTYEVGENEQSNVTKQINLQNTVSTQYNGSSCKVSSNTTYNFYIRLARSAPSIDGVANNAHTNDNVSLSVHGVGNLQVAITQNGKTYTYTYKNGDSIPTFVDPGKYFIKLTDEMGNSITKTFTINIRLNTAAIILIVVGAVIIVFTIVFIILSRTKVKVR